MLAREAIYLYPEFHAPGTYVAICLRERSVADKYVVSKPFHFNGSMDESAHRFAERALDIKGIVFVVPAHIFGNKCLKVLESNALNKNSETV